MRGYTIVVRSKAQVEKEKYKDLGQALAAVERHGIELERTAGQKAVGGALMRKFEPVQQVVGRVELRGPGRLRAGVDVRGDGSAEAFIGQVSRALVEQREGESAYKALSRELRP